MRHQLQGRIEIIVGCMFAGKTEEMMRRIRRAQIAGKDVKVFSQSKDSRYGEDCIGAHTGEKCEAMLVEDAQDILDEVEESTVIAVDEANFFTSNLIEVSKLLAENGKRVILCGLDQNFRGAPFHPVPELMAISEDVEKLSAVCSNCGGVATMTQRLDKNGNPVKGDDREILVSGDDMYEARCRGCHIFEE